MDPAFCLHSLLPPPRSTAITSRLRSSQSVPKVYTRTKRYCSFHGLRGIASPVLTATGFVSGRGQFLTPTESTPLDRSPKNLLLMIKSATLRLCKIWCKSVHGGLLGEWVKYSDFFHLFIHFFRELTYSQTRRRIFTLDGSNDGDSRRDVPFGGFVDIALHCGGEIPPPNPPAILGA